MKLDDLAAVFEFTGEEAEELARDVEQHHELPGSWQAYTGSHNYIECKEY